MSIKESTPYDSLQSELTHLQQVNHTLNQEVKVLQEQLSWFKRQIFGQRSEKTSVMHEDQMTFTGFDQVEESAVENSKTVKEHKRKKPNRKGQDKITIPDDLPVKTTILDLPEEEKTCSETGLPLVKIGEEVSHKLAHTPASYYIKETIRPKYAHPKKEENGVLISELPDCVIAKCRADESLLADICTKKYGDHLPLYRIEEMMSREGIKISRKLLSQWVLKSSLALKPLYKEMLKQVLSGSELFIDETPVKLHREIA